MRLSQQVIRSHKYEVYVAYILLFETPVNFFQLEPETFGMHFKHYMAYYPGFYTGTSLLRLGFQVS